MKITDQVWAKLGKVVAAVGTVLGLTLGAIQLSHSILGPRVVAIIDAERNVLSPRMRERLKTVFTSDELTRMIQASEEKKEKSDATLTEVKTALAKPRTDSEVALFDFDTPLSFNHWHITVRNDSSDVAKDVKLVLPGSGKADMSELPYGVFDPRKEPVEWKKELSLGTIPAHGRADVLVWTDEGLIELTDENVAVLHSDGAGSVRKMQHFYGWDADFVTWFLIQPRSFRYGALLLAALAVTLVARRIGKKTKQQPPVAAVPSSDPTQPA